jgi:hypothetical protein
MTDAVITHIYAMMEEQGYALRNPLGTAIKRDLVYTARRLPLFSALLEDRLPRNMPRQTLGMMLALDQTAEVMLEALERENAARVARSGMAMTGAQMRAFLETLPPAAFAGTFRATR